MTTIAESRAPVPSLAGRVWLLLLVDGLERAGATPVTNVRLHRLAFLANCLAPVYDLPSPDGKIMKYGRGPFYPALQWDVDRLVAQNLFDMTKFRHVRDELGPWFTAEYALSPTALRLLQFVLVAPQAKRMHAYLCEVASAYDALPELSRDAIALEDATYSDPAIHMGSLIDFAEWNSRNYSHRTANAFSNDAPEGVTLAGREKLHLYFRYLDRMLERAAGE